MAEKIPNSNSLPHMLKRCEAELREMKTRGFPPAPYYFERVAILARKAHNYELEVSCIENFVSEVETFYLGKNTTYIADIRKGPRFQAIVKRLPKAKELLAAQCA